MSTSPIPQNAQVHRLSDALEIVVTPDGLFLSDREEGRQFNLSLDEIRELREVIPVILTEAQPIVTLHFQLP